ncbi:MAG: hypothetical protein WAP03_15710, partial [Methylorubrum rhodinum]|uniref:hypothetical protein n=1 Tax=Methylorubrum rhodinum TaxID=29428 RepID=UPI003BAF80A1
LSPAPASSSSGSRPTVASPRRRRARILSIRSIPSLVVDERVLPATSNEAALRRMVEGLLDDPILHRRAS